MAPFEAGLAMIVAGTDVPVIPAALAGCHAAMPPDARVPRRKPIKLTLGPPLCFAASTDDRDSWRKVAADCEAAVRGLIVELTRNGSPRPESS